jgi:glycosyltransferase involved in cell wall biosynthesis
VRIGIRTMIAVPARAVAARICRSPQGRSAHRTDARHTGDGDATAVGRSRTDAGHHLAFGRMPVGYHPPTAVGSSAAQRRNLGLNGPRRQQAGAVAKHLGENGSAKIPGWESRKTVASVSAYRSISGEAVASNTPTIRCLPFRALTNFTHGSMTPLLSICIPTYNRAKLLRETLAHLREVCGDDVEIVISDNCSGDDTQDAIRSFASRFSHFRAIRQPENRGGIANFAAALSVASGKYLYPLSDDDRIYFPALMAAVAVMEEAAGITGVFGGYEEWFPDGHVLPIKLVEERTDFAQHEHMKILSLYLLLWHPVCRADIYRRFYMPDRRSFGMWELAGALLKHGGVSVIPDLFYKHAHTEPRMEFEMTENWYHDAYRAGFECFIGQVGSVNSAEIAAFIAGRTVPPYLHGRRFAMIKRDYLGARHFVLRSRAYGMIVEADVIAWEKATMLAMVVQRLFTRIELNPDVDQIVFEANVRLLKVRDGLAAIAPGYSFVSISPGELQLMDLRPNQYLVTYAHPSFAPGAAPGLDPARMVAVEDVIETCRITTQPLSL